ncbi:hypothetical protein LTR15_012828 [Elasticomyces elasticus]|nr:hypothetical protein LTR15_012828 [Elasticomyces elasticus]
MADHRHNLIKRPIVHLPVCPVRDPKDYQCDNDGDITKAVSATSTEGGFHNADVFPTTVQTPNGRLRQVKLYAFRYAKVSDHALKNSYGPGIGDANGENPVGESDAFKNWLQNRKDGTILDAQSHVINVSSGWTKDFARGEVHWSDTVKLIFNGYLEHARLSFPVAGEGQPAVQRRTTRSATFLAESNALKQRAIAAIQTELTQVTTSINTMPPITNKMSNLQRKKQEDEMASLRAREVQLREFDAEVNITFPTETVPLREALLETEKVLYKDLNGEGITRFWLTRLNGTTAKSLYAYWSGLVAVEATMRQPGMAGFLADRFVLVMHQMWTLIVAPELESEAIQVIGSPLARSSFRNIATLPELYRTNYRCHAEEYEKELEEDDDKIGNLEKVFVHPSAVSTSQARKRKETPVKDNTRRVKAFTLPG